MRNYKLVLLLTMILTLVTGLTHESIGAQSRQTLTLSGKVINQTTGEKAPPGATIILHIASTSEPLQTYTSTLTNEGSFEFNNLTTDESKIFIISMVYQGVTYISEAVPLSSPTGQITQDLVIYDTTEERTTITVDQAHIFIMPAGNRVQITEYYLVSNQGTRTYIGTEDPLTGQQSTLTFILPENAFNVEFSPSDNERYQIKGASLTDSLPILPGTATTEVRFSYELSYAEETPITRTFPVPVTAVVLAITGEELAIEGNVLQAMGTLDFMNASSLAYTGGPFAIGEALEFILVPRTTTDSNDHMTTTSQDSQMEVGIGLIALAISIAATYWLWRPSPSMEPPTGAQPLVEAIVALDRQLEAGTITPEKHAERRSLLKQRLYAYLDTNNREYRS